MQIREAADVVDDGALGRVVEQRVDGEVAAKRVLFRRAVDVVALDEALAGERRSTVSGVRRPRALPPLRASAGLCLGIGADVAPERGDLNRLGTELDVGQPEAAADDPAVAERALDLVGLRRRADVEILGPPPQEQVADAATDEIGGVAQLLEPTHHFQRVGVDVAAGEGMLCTWQDDGLNHRLRSIADTLP